MSSKRTSSANEEEGEESHEVQEVAQHLGSDVPHGDRHRANHDGIPNRNEIMQALGRLPGLVALKMLTPAQANTMRATYQTMLAEHYRSQPGQQAQISDDNVLRMLRAQPEMLSMIEPLLTSDQIAMVMQANAGEDDDGHQQ